MVFTVLLLLTIKPGHLQAGGFRACRPCLRSRPGCGRELRRSGGLAYSCDAYSAAAGNDCYLVWSVPG
jgi:hypothetical protein